jgi:hypothetical protein
MLLRSTATLVLVLAPAVAQDVGDPVPVDLPLSDFAVDNAVHFEEYTGRAVLIEFFAYW